MAYSASCESGDQSAVMFEFEQMLPRMIAKTQADANNALMLKIDGEGEANRIARLPSILQSAEDERRALLSFESVSRVADLAFDGTPEAVEAEMRDEEDPACSAAWLQDEHGLFISAIHT
jgi:hypothetical protein